MTLSEEQEHSLISITRYLVAKKGLTVEDAEDLAVVTVFKATKAFNESKGIPFIKWAFRQLRWTLIDFYRKKRDLPVEDIEDSADKTIHKEPIELFDEYKKSKEFVLKALDALDEESKKYFILTIFERKERFEIIEILKLDQNQATAISKRMKRVLKKVIKEMKIEYDDIKLDYFYIGGISND